MSVTCGPCGAVDFAMVFHTSSWCDLLVGGGGVDWKVRVCASVDEMRAAVSPIWHYFGRTGPNDDQIASLARVLPAERVHAVWDDGRAVGGAGAFPFTVTVPGGRRARGRRDRRRRSPDPSTARRPALDDARAARRVPGARRGGRIPVGHRGQHLRALRLWPRVVLAGDRSSPASGSAFYAPAERFGQVRLVPLGQAEPLVAPVWERVAAFTPGMFARTSAWWQARALADPDWRRRGGGDLRCAILEAGGRSAAYALYRLNPASDRGVQTGSLDVVEAMGDSPEATRAIWRFLLDVDLIARIKASVLPSRSSASPAGDRAAPAPRERARRTLGSARGRRRRAGGALVRGGGLHRRRGGRRVLSLEPGPVARGPGRRRAHERSARALVRRDGARIRLSRGADVGAARTLTARRGAATRCVQARRRALPRRRRALVP